MRGLLLRPRGADHRAQSRRTSGRPVTQPWPCRRLRPDGRCAADVPLLARASCQRRARMRARLESLSRPRSTPLAEHPRPRPAPAVSPQRLTVGTNGKSLKSAPPVWPPAARSRACREVATFPQPRKAGDPRPAGRMLPSTRRQGSYVVCERGWSSGSVARDASQRAPGRDRPRTRYRPRAQLLFAVTVRLAPTDQPERDVAS